MRPAPLDMILLAVFVIAALVVAFSPILYALSWDADIYRHGVEKIVSGENPYLDDLDINYMGFYAPPHAPIVAPFLFLPPRGFLFLLILSVGLFAYVFRDWRLSLYVLSPVFLVHGVGANNIGVQIGVLGVLLLWLARERWNWSGVLLTAWGWGALGVKPHMTGLVIVVHLLWLLWQGKAWFAAQVAAVCVLAFVVLPTLIGLLTGGRWLWLEWWQAVIEPFFFQRDFNPQINPVTDYEVFRNKWGVVAALLFTGLGGWVLWERQRITLLKVLLFGLLLNVIWSPYTDSVFVGLAWMLLMRPRQMAVYLLLLWWLALWIWGSGMAADEMAPGLAKLPEQAGYVMPVLILFCEQIIARAEKPNV